MAIAFVKDNCLLELANFFPHAPFKLAYQRRHMTLVSCTKMLFENAITSSALLPFSIASDLLKLANSSDTPRSVASSRYCFSSGCLNTWFAAGFHFLTLNFL